MWNFHSSGGQEIEFQEIESIFYKKKSVANLKNCSGDRKGDFRSPEQFCNRQDAVV
jgi:hypothetical protein